MTLTLYDDLVEHSPRQRHQLQYPPRRSDRIPARPGQAPGLVSSGRKMRRGTVAGRTEGLRKLV